LDSNQQAGVAKAGNKQALPHSSILANEIDFYLKNVVCRA
jgi:hypothetical protein